MRPTILIMGKIFEPPDVGVTDQAGSYQLISLQRTSEQNPSR